MIGNWVKRFPLVSNSAMGRRFRAFLLVFVAFLSLSPVVLSMLNSLHVDTYFVLAFVWLLISSEVFAPTDGESIWWIRVQRLKIGGWVVFAYILFQRVATVIQ
jgi:hypothetical protein